MPYQRPTLTSLFAQALGDVVAYAGPLLPKAVLRGLAWAQANLAHLHFGYLDWIAREAVPWTATDEYLTAWGALKGVLQKDAAIAVGSTALTGAVGTAIPVGTQLVRGDGVAYAVTASGTIGAGGTVTVPIAATLAGSAGNADDGTVLTLSAPVLGVNSDGAASGPLAAGADQEDTEAFRSRVLAAYAAPPQGGDQADYLRWATAVPGVSRAWVKPAGFGAGSVVVYAMFDDAEAAHGGFPQGSNGVAAGEWRDAPAAGDQLSVANAIFPVQPVTALVYVVAPNPQPVNFTISGLGAANTAANQAAMQAALVGIFRRQATALGGSIQQSAWETALAAVVPAFTVSAPAGAIASALGNLPVLGTVAFSA